jgi:hypothetical protein
VEEERMRVFDFLTGRDIDRRYDRMLALTRGIREGINAEYGYAVRLATALRDKHYPEATRWKPAPDTLGVLTQIDNMTTGLARAAPAREDTAP